MSKLTNYWNNVADSWQKQAENSNAYFSQRTQLVVKLLLHYINSGKVLEVGCGAGLLSYELVKQGFEVYGFDVAEKMVKNTIEKLSAIQENPDAYFRHSPNGQVPFEIKFHLIVAMGVFPYVQDHNQFLKMLCPYLEEGGYIVASNVNNLSLHTLPALAAHFLSWHPSKNWHETLTAILRTGLDTGGFVDYNPQQQCYGAEAFDRLFAQQGLTKIQEVDLFCLNPLPLDRKALERTKIGKYFARNLGFHHIGLYQKTSKISAVNKE
ncbi:MAG: class I SAM-dependent methyltransferase [Calothrix sp. MO_167.B12]|nr:class I SAM-dependent methyltransferase [Calothrix sp. MO_167.B12]